MIDLHCHILPGVDDGAADLPMALEMGRAFVDQGVKCIACTPHILPGLYHNTGPQIREAVARLQSEIDHAGIDLLLVTGADNHIIPEFVDQLNEGHLLALGRSRYVLVEPPHHVAPTQLEELFFKILVADFIPILTHPERLKWIEKKYDMIKRLASRGVWMQVTCGALRGTFGKRPRYWAERMLDEGLVHILASDAHDLKRRPPDLRLGYEAAERFVGRDEAHNLVVTRPAGALMNKLPSELPAPIGTFKTNKNIQDFSNAPKFNSTDTGGGLGQRLRRVFSH